MNLFLVGRLDPEETMGWIKQTRKRFCSAEHPNGYLANDPTAHDVIPFRSLTMVIVRPKSDGRFTRTKQFDDGKERLLQISN